MRRPCRSSPGGQDGEQLYELAKKRNVRGRSKMGKWDLIDALRA
jgi:hypothetical protein